MRWSPLVDASDDDSIERGVDEYVEVAVDEEELPAAFICRRIDVLRNEPTPASRKTERSHCLGQRPSSLRREHEQGELLREGRAGSCGTGSPLLSLTAGMESAAL